MGRLLTLSSWPTPPTKSRLLAFDPTQRAMARPLTWRKWSTICTQSGKAAVSRETAAYRPKCSYPQRFHEARRQMVIRTD